MALAEGDSSRFWDQLLELIEEGRVVPIVGPDLLIADVDGRPTHLHSYLAARLAEYLELPTNDLPEQGALHEVACRALNERRRIEEVYAGLKQVFPDRDRFSIPEPLRQLARVRRFQLFVTTNFDPFLQQALDEERFAGRPKTRVFAYSTTAIQDLDQSVDQMVRPAVFHLFGRLSAAPDYAVTEEDMLEHVHTLQSESRQPKRLFDELDRRNLLLLGGGFPDWLARFFLRAPRRDRLWQIRGRTDAIADARMRDDQTLVTFLKQFSSHTRISSQDAVPFVDELSRRWSALHPDPVPTLADETEASGTRQGPHWMEAGAVFLSYAREDRPRVEALREELDRAGVDVWYDGEDLEGGDDYRAKIKLNIEHCSVFVPLLSQNCLIGGRRFVRQEWDWAERVAAQARLTQRFIVPLALDDISPQNPDLPQRFRDLHWDRLVSGEANPKVVQLLKTSFRDYQRSQAEAAR